MEPGVAIAQDEQRQYKNLKGELARLSESIEKAKALYASFQFDTAEKTRLEKAIGGLTKTHENFKKKVSFLASQERAISTRLANIDKKLTPKEDTLKEVTALFDSTHEKVTAATAEVAQLRREKADLVAQKKEGFKNDLRDIAKDVAQAREILAGLTSAIGQARKDVADLTPKQEQYRGVVSDIAQARKTLDGITHSIVTQTGEIKRIETQKTKKGEELTGLQAAFEKRCEDREVQLRLREKDCDEREGGYNRREGWLMNKEKKLRQAKLELEEIHGKELRHITFE